jgi:uncharacterized protein YkwD
MKRTIHAFGLLLAGCMLSPEGSAQAVHYAGKVLDEAGKGLPGALVQVEGAPASATTGADGTFDLSTTVTAGVKPRALVPTFRTASPLLLAGNTVSLRGPGGLHRGDGRAVILSTTTASSRAASTAGSSALGGSTPAPTLAKPASGSSSEAAEPVAAYVIAVSKTGYITRKYSQSRTTALTLAFTLTKRPDSAGGYQAEKKLCMDEANRYRASVGLPAVAWSAALEAYADEGARYDAARNKAHAHFGAVKPNPADAENEIPGWPLSNYKTVAAVVADGIRMMWDEGPGGGHYENIKGNHTAIGCGIHVTEAGNVWIVQDFK